jgi:hypothetical protein
VVTGAASSALTGLLFVAVSVNAAQITKRPTLRASAAKTLLLFGSSLVVSIMLVIPAQARWVLGAELTAVGLITGLAMVLVGTGIKRAPAEPDDQLARLARLLDRASPYAITCVLIALAGISRFTHLDGGFYLLAPGVGLALVAGMTNTWLLLVRLSG